MACFLAWGPRQLVWTGDAAGLLGGTPPNDREALTAAVDPRDRPALAEVMRRGGSCAVRLAAGGDLLLHAAIQEPGAGIACLSRADQTVDEALRTQLADLSQRFRDVTHRTNNNLQTVMSIVSLKLGALIADPVRAADLREVLAKVQVVTLAQRALGEQGHAAIALDRYVRDLVAAVADLAGQEMPAMTLAPAAISAERAVSAGLVLYELMAAGPVRSVTLEGGDRPRLILDVDAAAAPSPLARLLAQHMGAELQTEHGRVAVLLPRQ